MEGIEIAAKLMELSAVTAPKSKGVSFVQTRILTGESLQKLADEMVRFGERTGKKDFDRDAKGVARSGAVVLIGLKDSKAVGLDCGACGYPDCKSFEQQARKAKEFSGPICAFSRRRCILASCAAAWAAASAAGRASISSTPFLGGMATHCLTKS